MPTWLWYAWTFLFCFVSIMSKLVIYPHANGHHGTPRICEMEENTLSLRGPVVEVTSYRRSSQYLAQHFYLFQWSDKKSDKVKKKRNTQAICSIYLKKNLTQNAMLFALRFVFYRISFKQQESFQVFVHWQQISWLWPVAFPIERVISDIRSRNMALVVEWT